MGSRHCLNLAVLAACAVASVAHGDEAEDALRRCLVYGEMHRISAREWERLYRARPERLQVPAAALQAGRNAFHLRDYATAMARFDRAEKRARDAGDQARSRAARTWRLACDAALKAPDAAARLKRAQVEAGGADELLLLAYVLDKHGLGPDSARKELYNRARKVVASVALAPEAERHRAWLAFRVEHQTAPYLALNGAPRPGGSPGDAELLIEMSTVYAWRAYELSPANSEIHARAALRLGLCDEVTRLSAAALKGTPADRPSDKLRAWTWRLLAAAAERAAGRPDRLKALRTRLADPACAVENKLIYHMMAHRLAEALLAAGDDAAALVSASAAVAHLEKHFIPKDGPDKLQDYFEQTRPIYAALAYALDRSRQPGKSQQVYAAILPRDARAWAQALDADPLFCVRYTSLLFQRNAFARTRELVYNEAHGLLRRYPGSEQLRRVGREIEQALAR